MSLKVIDKKNEAQTAVEDSIEVIVNQVESSGERVLDMVRSLMQDTASRKLVIWNYDDKPILQLPLAGAIMGGMLLTMILRLRSVVVLLIAAAFGRVYFSIEPYNARLGTAEVLETTVSKAKAATKSPGPARKTSASTASKTSAKSAPTKSGTASTKSTKTGSTRSSKSAKSTKSTKSTSTSSE